MPYTRTYSIILGMYSCFFMANTFLPLARLFFSGATFFRGRDFFFTGATFSHRHDFFFAGATFFRRRDFSGAQVGTLSRVIKVYQEMYQNSHVYPCIAMYTYVQLCIPM